MKKFILLTFAFLGVGFYELSGGADFDPTEARETVIKDRLERESLRQTEIAAWRPPDRQVDQTAPKDANADVAKAARAELDLVTFDTAAQDTRSSSEESSAAAEPLNPGPQADQVPLSELAGFGANEDAPLSIADLETEPEEQQNVAFAGSRQIASSAEIADAAPDIRTIKGTLVNMRSGPGTDYDIVDQLEKATEVEILTDGGNGWVELRPVTGGTTGWIAEFLLTGS